MDITNKALCHDCKKDMEIEDGEIRNGLMLDYDNGVEKITVFKCEDCFSKSKELRNYQPCEVYSRVVGYIRPVQQWHKGKKQEYQERNEYKAV